jgi:glyoxylase-like metal-dependent hydrolase (beta-lactamase superfamily II)
MNVIQFIHEGLGNSSYLAQVGEGEAVLIDPDRSIDRYLDTARTHGWKIMAVFETHLHADFVSGGLEVSKTTGAQLYLPAEGNARFPHNPLRGGQTVRRNRVEIEALATPSHTPEHMSFVLREPGKADAALFSGGALIVGGAARTDLISPDMTEPLTRSLYKTLRSAFTSLGDETLLYPTHGVGSFCSAGASGERTSTLGEQRSQNSLFSIDDEEEFVSWFPTTFPAGIPTYFSRMRPINQAGPRPRAEIVRPPRLSVDEFDSARENSLIVDLRAYEAFARAHIPGSINITFRDAYATFLGWLVSPETPVLFVTGDAPLDRVFDESLLVGHERFAGWLDGGIEAWIASGKPVADPIEIVNADQARKAMLDGAGILDVREPDEFEAGHIEGAINVPLGDVEAKLDRIPTDRPLLAYCGHGERSSTALSILQRAGAGPLLNLGGGFEGWDDGTSRGIVSSG